MAIKIKQLKGDRLLVRPLRSSLRYGVLHLPTSSARNTQVARIEFVGDKVENKDLQPGVVVIFDHLAGQIIDEEKHQLMLKEEDLLAIAEGEVNE